MEGGEVFIAFSGYAHDRREIFQIPEIRAFWQKLDSELPELPALLLFSQELAYNGPGTHLSMLGAPDENTIPADPHYFQRYNLYVEGADLIIARAVARIRAAGRKYTLSASKTERMVNRFLSGIRVD